MSRILVDDNSEGNRPSLSLRIVRFCGKSMRPGSRGGRCGVFESLNGPADHMSQSVAVPLSSGSPAVHLATHP